MRIFFGLLVATATIASAGFGVTALVARHRLTIWENCALAWLFGTAVVSLTLWAGGTLMHGMALQIMVTGVCVVLGALGFARWRTFPAENKTGSMNKAEIVFIALFGIELIAMFWLSFQRTLGWDGLFVWEIKAHYALLNDGVLPAAFFGDASRWFTNPDYPLLLPLTETWFYLWIGDCDQFWIKFIFPLWYGAAMSILLLAAAEQSEKRFVGWIIVLLFLLIPAVHDRPGGFQSGFADGPMAAMYLAAVFYLLRFIRDGSRDAMALFIALGAILPWMKPEGLALWATISSCGAIAIHQTRKNWSGAVLSFLPGICLIALWRIFLANVHVLPPQDFAVPSLGVLSHNIHRGIILYELFLQLIVWRDWGIFWGLPVIAMIALLLRERSVRGAALLWLFLAPLACYCAVFLFSSQPDYIWHIETSLGRHLLHLAPIACLLIALALRPSKQRCS